MTLNTEKWCIFLLPIFCDLFHLNLALRFAFDRRIDVAFFKLTFYFQAELMMSQYEENECSTGHCFDGFKHSRVNRGVLERVYFSCAEGMFLFVSEQYLFEAEELNFIS